MQIINCGYKYRHPENFKVQRPNGSGDCMLLIIHSPAFFVFNGETHCTTGNSVIIFKEGTPQIYGAANSEFINDWLHFKATKDDIDYLKSIGIVFDEIIEFQNVAELSKLVKYIYFEKYSNNKNSILSANLYFNLVLLKISDFFEQTPTPYSKLSHMLVSLRNKIYKNPQRNWRIDEIAKDLSISISYLQHQYKLLFSNSIKKDITISRIEYSKYLLFNTDYTISAISQMCGYENDVHFMRIFKKEVGITPTKYRTGLNFSHNKIEESRNYTPFSL